RIRPHLPDDAPLGCTFKPELAEKDDTPAIPCASTRLPHDLAHCQGRTTGRHNPLHFAWDEVPDVLAVWRPERKECPFGIGKWLSNRRIQRPHPELGLAGRIRCTERQTGSVW